MIDRVAVAEMSGSELVVLYNKLTGKTVKRFASHKDAIKRVLARSRPRGRSPRPGPGGSGPFRPGCQARRSNARPGPGRSYPRRSQTRQTGWEGRSQGCYARPDKSPGQGGTGPSRPYHGPRGGGGW